MDEPGRQQLGIYIPFEVLALGMAFTDVEIVNFHDLLQHCMLGLSREYLINPNFAFGSKQVMESKSVIKPQDNGGLFVAPSVLGSEMFLRAHGLKLMPSAILVSQTQLQPLPDITIPRGYRKPAQQAETPSDTGPDAL